MTANAGRPDYDAAIRDRLMLPGEPMFRLRGQDELAARTIRYWAALAFDAGVDPAVIEQALQQADAFDEWKDRKLPDADHMAEHDRLQLAFQLSRRAWRAAIPVMSIDDVLIAQREADQGKADERHESRRLKGENCKHTAWTFDIHGRLCPDCSTLMIEAGV